jgi:hypothetical protein
MIQFADINRKVGETADGLFDIVKSEVIFTHVDNEGTVRHFATARMEKAAIDRGMPIHSVQTNFETWNMVRLNNGIEQHRLNRITPQICLKPTLWVELPGRPCNGAHCTAIIVDGSHRYVYAFGVLGWKEIPAHVFPVGTWEEFLVDVPEELSKFDAERIRKQFNGGETFWSGIK